MRSISEENQKTYRKMVDVNVLIFSSPNKATRFWKNSNSESDWYDDRYIFGLREAEPYKRILLMDFAGSGFKNTGDCYPISDDPGANCKWGVPAAELGKGMSITVELYDDAEEGDEYTVIYGDSDGGIYYTTRTSGSSDGYLRPRIDYPAAWDPNERIYILYVNPGSICYFPTKRIVECNLNLRGVETKIESPSLQASEIEVKSFCNLTESYCGKITKGSRILYSAGYDGDMTEPRVFYVNAPIKQDSLSLTVTGYDMTDYLDQMFTTIYLSGVKTGAMADRLAYNLDIMIDNCAPHLSEFGIDSEHQPEWSVGTDTNILIEGEKVRDFVANACNVWNINGFFTRYVDAGYPYLRMTKSDYIETVYERPKTNEKFINLGTEPKVIPGSMISEFETINDFDIKTLTMPLNVFTLEAETQIDKRSTKTVGKTYKVQLNAIYGEFYVKSSESATVETDITKDVEIDSLNRAKIPIVYTPTQILYAKKVALEASTPYTKSKAGAYNCEVKEQNGEYKIRINGTDVKLGQKAVERMINRSQTMHSFTWRGDPRMQPMDVLTVNGIQMTVESLTLEHSGGGLLSKVVCRKGRV